MKIGDQPVNANSVENLYAAKGDSDSWERASLGMTLRQYYAGLAMQAICSNPSVSHGTYGLYAEESVKMADALLAELENTNDQA